MNRYWMLLCLMVCLPFTSLWAQEVDDSLPRPSKFLKVNTKTTHEKFVSEVDWKEFSSLVMQHEGRLLPLDSYARKTLFQIFRKRSYRLDDEKLTASQWFAELIFEPERAFERKVVKVLNDDVIRDLGMEPYKRKRLYSINALDEHRDQIIERYNELRKLDQKSYSAKDKEFINLYKSFVHAITHSRSFSLMHGLVTVKTDQFARELGVEKGGTYSYYDIYDKSETLSVAIQKTYLKLSQLFSKYEAEIEDPQQARQRAFKDLNEYDNEVLFFQSPFEYFVATNPQIQDERAMSLVRCPIMLPPSENEVDDKEEALLWQNPWKSWMTSGNQKTPALDLLATMNRAYMEKDAIAFNDSVKKYKYMVGHREKIDMEVTLNKGDFFYRSLYCYIAAFLLLFFSFPFKVKWPKTAGLIFLYVALILCTMGITMRCLISGRPPVTTLFESVVFVSAVVSLCMVIGEHFHKKHILSLGASIVGVILMFVAFAQEADGDSDIGVMRAVLDSNFWLATHVLTITIGYALCFVVGILGHLYLALKINNFRNYDLKRFMRIIHWFSIVALFFSTLGTILGGIWADQSWGRFWGWDPKENGAMLIVLWLLFLVHGRITGQLRDIGYAAGLIILNIIVALAWFGVNLLGVGLHFYGFKQGTFNALAIFVGVELFFAAVLGLWAKLAEERRMVKKTL